MPGCWRKDAAKRPRQPPDAVVNELNRIANERTIPIAMPTPAAAAATEPWETIYDSESGDSESAAPPEFMPKVGKPKRRWGLIAAWVAAVAIFAGGAIVIATYAKKQIDVEKPAAAVVSKPNPPVVPEARKPAEIDKAKPKFPPLDAAWVSKVKALPAREQIVEVSGELVKRNPDYAGIGNPAEFKETIKNDRVVELRINTKTAGDLTPLQSLPFLEFL